MSKENIKKILSKYDEKTRIVYSQVIKLERDNRHKVKRQDVRDNIKLLIDRVVSDENKEINIK